MKQQAKNDKLFRNCPFSHVDFESCSECSNYNRCIKKKKERKCARRAKRVERFVNVTLPLIMALATLVTAISALIMCAGINSEPQKTESTNTTSAPATIAEAEMEKQPEPKVDSNFEETLEEIPQKEEVEEVEVEDENSTTETEQIVEAKVSAEGPSATYYYQLSEHDKLIIAKLVWAEARGESFKGKVAVASVVINRCFYGKGFGTSIEGIVTASGQFASIKDVTMADLKAVPECMEAVEAACKGWDPTREVFQEGALFFYAPKGVKGYQKQIREGIEVMTIGNHNFHLNFEKVK